MMDSRKLTSLRGHGSAKERGKKGLSLCTTTDQSKALIIPSAKRRAARSKAMRAAYSRVLDKAFAGTVDSGQVIYARGHDSAEERGNKGLSSKAATARAQAILSEIRARIVSTSAGRDALDQALVLALVPELVQTMRTSAGLSQSQLATILGQKQPEVARLESTRAVRVNGPTIGLLSRIAHACDGQLTLVWTPPEGSSANRAEFPL